MTEEEQKAADAAEITRLLALVAGGRADGRLLDVAQAVDARIADIAGPNVDWIVTWGDKTLAKSDVSLGEADWLEHTVTTTWDRMEPGVLAAWTLAPLAVLVARDEPKPDGKSLSAHLSAVLDRLESDRTVKPGDVTVSRVEVPPSPLDAGSTSEPSEPAAPSD